MKKISEVACSMMYFLNDMQYTGYQKRRTGVIVKVCILEESE